MVDTVIVENEVNATSAASWPAIFAGAAVIGAASLIMLALGTGLGLSLVSPWGPSDGMGAETTKAATFAGIYLTVTAVLASAVGGYVTGRLRALWPGTHPHEVFFRDTAHGLVAWAVAALVGAVLIGSAGASIVGGAAREGARYAARDTGAAEYTDRLFDYDPATVGKPRPGQETASMSRDYSGDRAAAGRLIVASTMPGHVMTTGQREGLAVMVAARTGMALPDAEKRVAAVEIDARNAAETARHVGMILSFWLVASMLAGALASSLAAWEGGAVRDGRLVYAAR